MGTKFVIHLAAGLPPARTLITNFVLSLFSGLDMLYIYILFIYIYSLYRPPGRMRVALESAAPLRFISMEQGVPD